MQVNMLDAKTRLSRLVAAAERGEEVLIARNGVPVARLVRYVPPRVRPPGAWRGTIEYARDWNSRAANEAVSALFRGDDDATAP